MTRNRIVKKIIGDAVDKIVAEYAPEKIILYGSYAYGKPTADSDIDLFIIKETNKRRVDRFVEVSRMIYRPGLRIPIEPMVYTPKEVDDRLAMGDDFVAEVLEKGEVLYAR